VTEIYLGFASSRIHEKGGELHYDMWPALGTQMTMPVRGLVSSYKVIRNTSEQIVLSKGLFRYTFGFSSRQAGPDSLRYSVNILGIVPCGTHWGDISAEGKLALRRLFGYHGE